MNSMIETCMSIFNQNNQQNTSNQCSPDIQLTSYDDQPSTSNADHHKKSTLVRPLFMRQGSVTNNRTDKLSLVALPNGKQFILLLSQF